MTTTTTTTRLWHDVNDYSSIQCCPVAVGRIGNVVPKRTPSFGTCAENEPTKPCQTWSTSKSNSSCISQHLRRIVTKRFPTFVLKPKSIFFNFNYYTYYILTLLSATAAATATTTTGVVLLPYYTSRSVCSFACVRFNYCASPHRLNFSRYLCFVFFCVWSSSLFYIYTVFQKNPRDYVFDDNLNSKRPIVIIFGTVIT